ncbi:MAG: hypothetical protein R3E45_07350 [Rhodocyclaceae bacterium]|nr:hypothetical protein [Zoogloeaceae bacterium]MCP5256173.1 hypothetical protein [Zoogloeaceae bacterium]MCW5616825.1 hypothetical protein [Rhodocyclaceae bacterium]
MNKRTPLLPLAILVPVLVAAGPVRADDADALNVVVSQSFYYDSNLYRLGDGVEPTSGERSDTVSSTGLGLRFGRDYGRQGLAASVDINHNAYASNDQLDYTGTNADLGWNWVLGDRWSGKLGFSRSEQLSGFDDYGGQDQSINIYRRAEASANYWYHPSWAVGAGYARIRSRYSNGTRPGSEYDADVADVRLTYQPKSGNRIALKLASTQGVYPRRTATLLSDREYSQTDLRVEADWRVTGATRLSGYIGQTRRSYDFTSNRDFSGLTGRIAADWAVSGKTFISAVFRREIGAQEDLVDNFVVTEALSLSPRWQITDKTQLGAVVEWRRRDYGGDPGLLAGSFGDRSDITRRFGLNLGYQPMRSLSLYLSLQHQLRSASATSSGYDADSASVSASFTF